MKQTAVSFYESIGQNDAHEEDASEGDMAAFFAPHSHSPGDTHASKKSKSSSSSSSMKVASSISPAKPTLTSKKGSTKSFSKRVRVIAAVSPESTPAGEKRHAVDTHTDRQVAETEAAVRAKSIPGHNAYAWLVRALRIFYDENGHFAVPLYYKIPVRLPSAQPWPEPLRGARLGKELATFMDVSYEAENGHIVMELFAMGFPLVSDWKQYLWEELTMQCLRIYYKSEGDVNVPPSFIVPSQDEQWPFIAWGFALGAQMEDVRNSHKCLPRYQTQDLDALGFTWDSLEAKWFGAFLPALRTFREVHGESKVPEAFVVPKGRKQQKWAPKLARYPLGKACQEVRSGEYFDFVTQSADELRKLDFDVLV